MVSVDLLIYWMLSSGRLGGARVPRIFQPPSVGESECQLKRLYSIETTYFKNGSKVMFVA